MERERKNVASERVGKNEERLGKDGARTPSSDRLEQASAASQN